MDYLRNKLANDFEFFCWYTKQKRKTMVAFSKAKPFATSNTAYYGHEGFATQAEAEDAAKQTATKSMEDVAVFKAVSLVKAPIPSDIIVEVLS